MSFERLKAATAALMLAAALSACGVGEAKVSERAAQGEATPIPVSVVVPRTGDIHATYQTTSTITTDADAPVLARVAGEVMEILVEEGDVVEQGRLLARLDGERLRLQMLEAKANLEKARKMHDRYVQLHRRGLVSASVFEGMQFDLTALDASYELKRLNYSYTNIRAPIAGVVSSRDTKLGQHVLAGTPVFRITDTTKLIAYLHIPQTELSKITAGNEARLRVDALPDMEFEATVERISPTIDSRNGTFKATASIDNREGRLAPGMFGRFEIAYEKHAAALLIPATALVDEDDELAVYVVQDGEANRRTIRVGIRAQGMVEVLDGIEAGEQIVVVGQNALRDGARVLASRSADGRTAG